MSEDIFEEQGRSCFTTKGVMYHPQEHCKKVFTPNVDYRYYWQCSNCGVDFLPNGDRHAVSK